MVLTLELMGVENIHCLTEPDLTDILIERSDSAEYCWGKNLRGLATISNWASLEQCHVHLWSEQELGLLNMEEASSFKFSQKPLR